LNRKEGARFFRIGLKQKSIQDRIETGRFLGSIDASRYSGQDRSSKVNRMGFTIV
jgi:hypothetical protein